MSIQNTEYEKLVHHLEATTEEKEINGVKVVVKAIPDSDIEGDFDPRVLENVRKQSHPSQPTGDVPLNMADFPIQAIRAQMGWPNKDVTKNEINVEYVTINSEEVDIPARVYSPKTEQTLPAIVFFHGGGFIGGTLDTVENPCKALSEKANAVVVSVDYRLAPENPFPKGLNDCFEAVKWVYEHSKDLGINKEQIAVSGDSAGGNLATVCSLVDKQQQTNMIKYQALIYPVVNLGGTETEDYRWSIDEYEVLHHHDLLEGTIMGLAGAGSMFNELYLQGSTEMTNPHVSPLLAEDLYGLPETLIITAEYDYLRLEGEAFAKKLSRFGVKTKLLQYKGMDHAFIDKIGEYPQAEDCLNEIAIGLKSVFSAEQLK